MEEKEICGGFFKVSKDVLKTRDDWFRAAIDGDLDKIDEFLEMFNSESGEFLKACNLYIDAHDKNETTALVYAVKYFNKEVSKRLLSEGANPNLKDEYEKSALIYAVCDRDVDKNEDLIQTLLENGADVFVQDKNGSDLCSLAERHGNCEVADVIRNYQEMLNVKDKLNPDSECIKGVVTRLNKFSNSK